MSLQMDLVLELMCLTLNTLKCPLTFSNICIKQISECHYIPFRRKTSKTNCILLLQYNSIYLTGAFKEKKKKQNFE